LRVAAARPAPSLVGSAAFLIGLFSFAGGCGDDSGLDAGGDTSTSTETETETETETGDGDGDGELLSAEPEIILHPNQPMVVDVIVELERAGQVELHHDEDLGVQVVSWPSENEGRRHHLRVRGLAPSSDHSFTLTATDLNDDSASVTRPLTLTTNHHQPGFRPSFEVEVSDAAALDPSYRLFDYTNAPLFDPSGIFVIDASGVTRWYYNSGSPEFAGPTAIWAGIEMLEDGSMLALRDAAVTVIDELGEQRLRFSAFDYDLPAFHHEAHMLGNGNILTLCNSFRDIDFSSLDIGLGLTHVAADLLIEIDPAGEIVWTWDAFDHLDPLRLRSAPGAGLTYVNTTGEEGYDWTHGNGMVHSAHDDLILLSMRHQNWIVAIDHGTGEVAWRLGDEGDFELLEGSWFYHQHSPQWQPDGSLLLYDNAIGNPNVPYPEVESRAVRYVLDYDAMTATQVWDSRHGAPVIVPVAGDADRTPAGNVLVLDSSMQPDPLNFDVGKNYSRLTEQRYEGDTTPIWSLTTKLGSFVYRATAIERLPGDVGQ